MNIQCFVIDPFARTITVAQYNGDYRSISKMIDCDLFTPVRINSKRDTVFVDDEGLINGKPQEFFLIEGYPDPLAGKGVILGCDSVGDTVAPTITEEQVRKMVSWVTPLHVNRTLLWIREGA